MDRSCRRFATIALLLAVPAMLAGCSRKPELPACPVPSIVSGAESAAFGNTGIIAEITDPTQIVYRATLLGFGGGCGHNRSGTVLRLTLDISAVAGPAYDGRVIAIPYFVAVANPAGQIIDKQVFQASFTGPRAREAVGVQDMIEQTLEGVDEADAPNWKIYLGIDMPEDTALRRWDRS